MLKCILFDAALFITLDNISYTNNNWYWYLLSVVDKGRDANKSLTGNNVPVAILSMYTSV